MKGNIKNGKNNLDTERYLTQQCKKLADECKKINAGGFIPPKPPTPLEQAKMMDKLWADLRKTTFRNYMTRHLMFVIGYTLICIIPIIPKLWVFDRGILFIVGSMWIIASLLKRV
jgi:hypothetical protein